MSRTVEVVYGRPGKGTTTYTERVLLDRPDIMVLRLDGYTGAGGDIYTGGVLTQAAGRPITWFVLPEQWFELGLFSDRDGNPTGWYTNIITPPVIQEDTIECTDLFLDLWQPFGGAPEWLDQDEFDAAVREGTIAHDLAERALQEQDRITTLADQLRWPPDSVIQARRSIGHSTAR